MVLWGIFQRLRAVLVFKDIRLGLFVRVVMVSGLEFLTCWFIHESNQSRNAFYMEYLPCIFTGFNPVNPEKFTKPAARELCLYLDLYDLPQITFSACFLT